MKADDLAAIAALIRGQRQAALGTLHGGAPYVSMVAYAAQPDLSSLLLHLSRLAPHTQHLLADPRAALLICEPDDGRNDVQTLARLTLMGTTTPIASDSPPYHAARARYLARLPAAAPLFAFPDFVLFRFEPHAARYVGGFARALTLTTNDLRAAAQHYLNHKDTKGTKP